MYLFVKNNTVNK